MYLEEPLVNVTCTQIYMYIWTHLSLRRIGPFTSPLQLCLFLATLVASVCHWNQRSCLSLSMVLLQVSFGQRLFLLPSGVHDMAIFACLLLSILFQPFPPSWKILHLCGILKIVTKFHLHRKNCAKDMEKPTLDRFNLVVFMYVSM